MLKAGNIIYMICISIRKSEEGKIHNALIETKAQRII